MRPTICIHTDNTVQPWENRVRYIVDFLSAHPLCAHVNWLLNPSLSPENARIIHYGTVLQSGFHLLPEMAIISVQPGQKFHFSPIKCSHGNTAVYGVTTTASVGERPFYQESHFGFDWIATLFFHLSRIEEYAPDQTDDIGLMPSSQLLTVRAGTHLIPVVDHLVKAILEVLDLPVTISKVQWVVTHDLDTLQIFGPTFNLLRYLGGTAIRHRAVHFWPQIIIDYCRVRLGKMPDPGDNLDWLLQSKQAHQGILYLGTGTCFPWDQFPEQGSARMKEIGALAVEHGYTLGFHPGYAAWNDFNKHKTEKKILEKYNIFPIKESRQHFLRFAFPETADILEQSGIETDSSLGFRDLAGFRCGTAYPFHLYSFMQERAYTWRERPLIIMDIALLRSSGFDIQTAEAITTQILNHCHTGGNIVTDFHNTIFYEQERAGIPLKRWYSNLLNNK